jgi:hypothetical protein
VRLAVVCSCHESAAATLRTYLTSPTTCSYAVTRTHYDFLCSVQGSAILASYAGIVKGNPVGQMSGTGQYNKIHLMFQLSKDYIKTSISTHHKPVIILTHTPCVLFCFPLRTRRTHLSRFRFRFIPVFYFII